VWCSRTAPVQLRRRHPQGWSWGSTPASGAGTSWACLPKWRPTNQGPASWPLRGRSESTPSHPLGFALLCLTLARLLLLLPSLVGERAVRRLGAAVAECTSLFMEDRLEWMGDLADVEGKLLCPRCSYRVGSYHWSGAQCSCGYAAAVLAAPRGGGGGRGRGGLLT
jgi:hypothetical protein